MDRDADLSVPRMATYFACYPDPIGLPSTGAHLILFDGSLSGYEDLQRVALHYEADEPLIEFAPSAMPNVPFVSVRFHRGERNFSPIVENIHELLDVVGRLAPALDTRDSGRSSARAGGDATAYTVVEMVTPLIVPSGSEFQPATLADQVMGPNLTRCIAGFRRVVTAYRLSQGAPIAVPARERLGPNILGSTRPADPSHGGWDDQGSMVVNSYATYRPVAMPLLEPSQFVQQMESITVQLSVGHPGVAVVELKADAKVALHQAGDFRSAVMLLHTASEVMLDAVLMTLCWEEGMSPEVAALEFTAPLMSRVRMKYHDRLGGDWTTKSNSTVQQWRTRLVLLRHAVAHRGLVPERDQAEMALAAFEAMQTHVLNRLVARVGKYPVTVGLMVGEAELKRRGGPTRKAAAALQQVSMDTVFKFAAWRDLLLKASTRAEE